MAGKLKTAVLGATGYSGLELTRILVRHPRVEKPALLQRSSNNGHASDLADVFPALSGNGGFCNPNNFYDGRPVRTPEDGPPPRRRSRS